MQELFFSDMWVEGQFVQLMFCFLCKKKSITFKRTKILLLFLKSREREKKKLSNLSEINLDRYLVVYFLSCSNAWEQK